MLPLQGYLVVSIDQAVAAPLAARNLADLGARVIKVERTGTGDFARGYDHEVLGTGSHFVWLNRGKESVSLDLANPECLGALRALLAKADVFMQNLAPGSAERLGLGAEQLRAERPELIVASLSGYGSGGPYSGRKAYDMLIQADAALISVTGNKESAVKTGIPTSDIAAGMYTSQAVVAALLRRERSGEGASIDVSMFEATAEWMGHAMYMQMFAGRQIERMGLGHASIAPYDGFPASDGQVLIGVQSDSGWRTLATEILHRPELADDPRFATNVARVANRAELDALIGAETVRWSAAELTGKLVAANIPAAQINLVAGLVDHPQLAARDRWRQVDTEGGPIPALLPPATFADVSARRGAVPALGEHTVPVLREAGLAPEQIERLLASGAAFQHTPAA